MLGKDVGKFVKHFIVPLQIYMCDTVASVNQTATEVFNVLLVITIYLQSIIPDEKRESVQSKYYEETITFAESLLHVDNTLLEKYSEGSGMFSKAGSRIEEVEDAINRLQLTSQKTYTYLLRLRLSNTPSSIALYRDAFMKGMTRMLDSSHIETLELIKEIASQITWEQLFENQPSKAKKCKQDATNLLFEISKKQRNVMMSHLEFILALWIAISSK